MITNHTKRHITPTNTETSPITNNYNHTCIASSSKRFHIILQNRLQMKSKHNQTNIDHINLYIIQSYQQYKATHHAVQPYTLIQTIIANIKLMWQRSYTTKLNNPRKTYLYYNQQSNSLHINIKHNITYHTIAQHIAVNTIHKTLRIHKGYNNETTSRNSSKASHTAFHHDRNTQTTTLKTPTSKAHASNEHTYGTNTMSITTDPAQVTQLMKNARHPVNKITSFCYNNSLLRHYALNPFTWQLVHYKYVTRNTNHSSTSKFINHLTTVNQVHPSKTNLTNSPHVVLHHNKAIIVTITVHSATKHNRKAKPEPATPPPHATNRNPCRHKLSKDPRNAHHNSMQTTIQSKAITDTSLRNITLISISKRIASNTNSNNHAYGINYAQNLYTKQLTHCKPKDPNLVNNSRMSTYTKLRSCTSIPNDHNLPVHILQTIHNTVKDLITNPHWLTVHTNRSHIPHENNTFTTTNFTANPVSNIPVQRTQTYQIQPSYQHITAIYTIHQYKHSKSKHRQTLRNYHIPRRQLVQTNILIIPVLNALVRLSSEPTYTLTPPYQAMVLTLCHRNATKVNAHQMLTHTIKQIMQTHITKRQHGSPNTHYTKYLTLVVLPNLVVTIANPNHETNRPSAPLNPIASIQQYPQVTNLHIMQPTHYQAKHKTHKTSQSNVAATKIESPACTIHSINRIHMVVTKKITLLRMPHQRNHNATLTNQIKTTYAFKHPAQTLQQTIISFKSHIIATHNYTLHNQTSKLTKLNHHPNTHPTSKLYPSANNTYIAHNMGSSQHINLLGKCAPKILRKRANPATNHKRTSPKLISMHTTTYCQAETLPNKFLAHQKYPLSSKPYHRNLRNEPTPIYFRKYNTTHNPQASSTTQNPPGTRPLHGFAAKPSRESQLIRQTSQTTLKLGVKHYLSGHQDNTQSKSQQNKPQVNPVHASTQRKAQPHHSTRLTLRPYLNSKYTTPQHHSPPKPTNQIPDLTSQHCIYQSIELVSHTSKITPTSNPQVLPTRRNEKPNIEDPTGNSQIHIRIHPKLKHQPIKPNPKHQKPVYQPTNKSSSNKSRQTHQNTKTLRHKHCHSLQPNIYHKDATTRTQARAKPNLIEHCNYQQQPLRPHQPAKSQPSKHTPPLPPESISGDPFRSQPPEANPYNNLKYPLHPHPANRHNQYYTAIHSSSDLTKILFKGRLLQIQEVFTKSKVEPKSHSYLLVSHARRQINYNIIQNSYQPVIPKTTEKVTPAFYADNSQITRLIHQCSKTQGQTPPSEEPKCRAPKHQIPTNYTSTQAHSESNSPNIHTGNHSVIQPETIPNLDNNHNQLVAQSTRPPSKRNKTIARSNQASNLSNQTYNRPQNHATTVNINSKYITSVQAELSHTNNQSYPSKTTFKGIKSIHKHNNTVTLQYEIGQLATTSEHYKQLVSKISKLGNAVCGLVIDITTSTEHTTTSLSQSNTCLGAYEANQQLSNHQNAAPHQFNWSKASKHQLFNLQHKLTVSVSTKRKQNKPQYSTHQQHKLNLHSKGVKRQLIQRLFKYTHSWPIMNKQRKTTPNHASSKSILAAKQAKTPSTTLYKQYKLYYATTTPITANHTLPKTHSVQVSAPYKLNHYVINNLHIPTHKPNELTLNQQPNGAHKSHNNATQQLQFNIMRTNNPLNTQLLFNPYTIHIIVLNSNSACPSRIETNNTKQLNINVITSTKKIIKTHHHPPTTKQLCIKLTPVGKNTKLQRTTCHHPAQINSHMHIIPTTTTAVTYHHTQANSNRKHTHTLIKQLPCLYHNPTLAAPTIHYALAIHHSHKPKATQNLKYKIQSGNTPTNSYLAHIPLKHHTPQSPIQGIIGKTPTSGTVPNVKRNPLANFMPILSQHLPTKVAETAVTNSSTYNLNTTTTQLNTTQSCNSISSTSSANRINTHLIPNYSTPHRVSSHSRIKQYPDKLKKESVSVSYNKTTASYAQNKITTTSKQFKWNYETSIADHNPNHKPTQTQYKSHYASPTPKHSLTYTTCALRASKETLTASAQSKQKLKPLNKSNLHNTLYNRRTTTTSHNHCVKPQIHKIHTANITKPKNIKQACTNRLRNKPLVYHSQRLSTRAIQAFHMKVIKIPHSSPTTYKSSKAQLAPTNPKYYVSLVSIANTNSKQSNASHHHNQIYGKHVNQPNNKLTQTSKSNITSTNLKSSKQTKTNTTNSNPYRANTVHIRHIPRKHTIQSAAHTAKSQQPPAFKQFQKHIHIQNALPANNKTLQVNPQIIRNKLNSHTNH
eukprot:gene3074-2056_t